MTFSAEFSARRAFHLFVLLAMAFALLMVSGCGGTVEESSEEATTKPQGKETVVILKTNQGDITVRFFGEVSPRHTENFIAHAKSGLYTGTLFHRVIPGFMVQGGDPNSKDDNPSNDGMGGYSFKGPGTMVDAEFNNIPHTRGILSMARSQNVNSAGSQFFIVHARAASLDGKYSVFGEVIDGIEVVDFIVNAPRNSRDRPDEDQIIREVLVEEWTVADIEKSKEAMWAEDNAVNAK